MDYAALLSRTWDIIWRHKFLILLGILVALTSGPIAAASSGSTWRFGAGAQDTTFRSATPIWLAALLMGAGLAVAFVLWAISTLARGGLIAGAAAADGGQRASFSRAWAAGWERAPTLLGIAMLPAVPGLLMLLVAGLAFLGGGSGATRATGIPNLAFLFGLLACIALPLAPLLEVLRAFANRACMLEGLGVLDAYRRGLQVLFANLGSALVLLVIQVVALVVIFVLLIVPGLIMALCCVFWPFVLLFHGAVTAYFSTLWTMAWRRWTGVTADAGITVAG